MQLYAIGINAPAAEFWKRAVSNAPVPPREQLSSIGRTPVLMPNLGISFNFELFFSMKKLMPGLGISFNRFSALNLVYLTP